MTARWKTRQRKKPVSAHRVEHTGHCSEISTKTKLSNHIKIDGFCDRNSTNVPVKIVEEKKKQKVEKTATVHKKSVVSITTLKDIQRKKNKKTKNVQGVTKNRQIQSKFYKTAIKGYDAISILCF